MLNSGFRRGNWYEFYNISSIDIGKQHESRRDKRSGVRYEKVNQIDSNPLLKIIFSVIAKLAVNWITVRIIPLSQLFPLRMFP